MRRCVQIGCLVVFLMMVISPGFAQDDPAAPGFTPSWKVGDRWVLEATYRDLKQPGEVWLPPVQWVFKVRSIKNVHRQDCYAIHIFPKRRDLKVQAILYLSVKDLHPVRVIDIFPTPAGVKSQERDLDPFHPEPLSSEGSLVPYDLPVFPLTRHAVQRADGLTAYAAPPAKTFNKVRKIGGLKFGRQVSQRTQRPDRQHADTLQGYRIRGEAFQVELGETRSERNLLQLWQDGAPWALSAESRERRIRLVPSSAPTPLPTTPTGGDDQ